MGQSYSLPVETLTEIVESAPEAIFVTDLEGRYVFVNGAAAEVLGVDAGSALGRTASEVAGQEAAGPVGTVDRDVLAPGIPPELDGLMGSADGSRVLAVTKFPIHDESGSESGFCEIATDVTERVRLAKEVDQERQRLQYLLDHAPAYFAICDAEGVLRFLSGHRLDEMDRDPSGVVGRHFEEILKDEPVMLDQTRRALRGESVVGDVERAGRIIERRIAPALDVEGRPGGAIAVGIDVTEHRLVERELLAITEKLDFLMRANPVVIGETNLAGDAVVFVSSNVERVFGYRPTELLGEPAWLEGHSHPDDQAVVRDMLEDAAASADGAGESRFRILHASGGYRWVDVRVHVQRDGDGTATDMLWYSSDVTDWVLAEDERRIAAQRRHHGERLEALGQLAAGVAHDFNNLLTVMLANASLIRLNLTAEPGEEPDPTVSAVRRCAAEIELSATHAAGLARRMLSFGRSDQTEPTIVRLDALIADTATTLRHTVGPQIELSIDVGADCWPVMIDGGEFERGLLNLAANGRDAMAGRGELVIATDNIDLAGPREAPHPDAAPGRYVRLTVTDTGEGMTPEVAERAFEPFFTTKPEGQGAGLGLATVYAAVRSAGGWVGIDSAPGVGTKVSVWLPAVDAAQVTAGANPRSPVPPRRASGGETVLLVDDDEAVLRAGQDILSGYGYTVITASGGPAALAFCAETQQRIDLVLTDIAMPGMSGAELAAQALNLRPNLRIGFMSGYAADVSLDQRELRRAGQLLRKPFGAEELVRTVNSCLEPTGHGR